MYSTIEKYLETHDDALIQTVGISMEPMLHNRKSSVLLKKPQHPLKKYDVVLFQRDDNTYVLHRIVKVKKGGYIIRGDNCTENEYVLCNRVIGVMEGFFETEQNCFITLNAPGYQRYIRLLPIRYTKKCVRALMRRIYRKILR